MEEFIMSKVDKFIDATGLACPMPVVRARQAIDRLDSGQLLEIHTTDAGSKSDLTAWANSGGHEIVEQIEEDEQFQFLIRKK